MEEMIDLAKRLNASLSKIENWYKHKRRSLAKKGLFKLKNKRYFKKDELQYLQKMFIIHPRPTKEIYKDIAANLNCDESHIKNWYSNRRKKQKLAIKKAGILNKPFPDTPVGPAKSEILPDITASNSKIPPTQNGSSTPIVGKSFASPLGTKFSVSPTITMAPTVAPLNTYPGAVLQTQNGLAYIPTNSPWVAKPGSNPQMYNMNQVIHAIPTVILPAYPQFGHPMINAINPVNGIQTVNMNQTINPHQSYISTLNGNTVILSNGIGPIDSRGAQILTFAPQNIYGQPNRFPQNIIFAQSGTDKNGEYIPNQANLPQGIVIQAPYSQVPIYSSPAMYQSTNNNTNSNNNNNNNSNNNNNNSNNEIRQSLSNGSTSIHSQQQSQQSQQQHYYQQQQQQLQPNQIVTPIPHINLMNNIKMPMNYSIGNGNHIQSIYQNNNNISNDIIINSMTTNKSTQINNINNYGIPPNNIQILNKYQQQQSSSNINNEKV